jgi:hypothetical protein
MLIVRAQASETILMEIIDQNSYPKCHAKPLPNTVTPKGGDYGQRKEKKETEQRKNQQKGQKESQRQEQRHQKSQEQKITRLEPKKAEG